jgi:integrase
MPKQQQGTVVKRGARNYGARYTDEHHRRRYQGGFTTQTAAEAWLRTRCAEVAAVRRGSAPLPGTLPTVGALIDTYLATHEVDPATTAKLRHWLAHARRAFGDTRIDQLQPVALQAWRATLPPRTRHRLFGALKQVLEDAVRLGLLGANPCARVPNRRVQLDEDREIQPFASWAEVEAVGAELPERYRAVPVVLVGTGLRPEELWGLERRDIDREQGVLRIERVYTQGRLKSCLKTDRQRRRVPLRASVLAALDAMPPRIDTPVLFPARGGGHTKHATFRYCDWTPALRAAGIEHHSVYACRHTFAAWSIRAGVQLYYLARIMGTSVAQIDATYGHLVPDSDEYLRGLLDVYDAGRTGTVVAQ